MYTTSGWSDLINSFRKILFSIMFFHSEWRQSWASPYLSTPWDIKKSMLWISEIVLSKAAFSSLLFLLISRSWSPRPALLTQDGFLDFSELLSLSCIDHFLDLGDDNPLQLFGSDESNVSKKFMENLFPLKK